VAALAAALGTSLLLGASASARMAQTIALTSSRPSSPVAGVGSYAVPAQSSSGRSVELFSNGAGAARVRGSGAAETARGRANRARAEEDTASSLTKLKLPPGAHSGAEGCNTYYGRGTADVVGARGKWSSDEQVPAVLAFLEAHPPAGSRIKTIHTSTGRESTRSIVEFQWPAVSWVLIGRWLIVEIGNYGSGNPTEICASAEDVFADPLAPAYDVPSSARVLEVSIPREGQPALTVSVTSAKKIRAVRAMIDRMSVSWNQAGRKCKGPRTGPPATFTFRARSGGRVLAVASANNHVEVEGGPCNAMKLRVQPGGRTEELEDGPFIREAQKLLGVQIYMPRERLQAEPTTTTPATAPEPHTATLILHLYQIGGPAPPAGCYETKCPVEGRPVSVRKLGPNREVVSSFETTSLIVAVAPGEYVLRLGRLASQGLGEGKTVTVGPGQIVDVTLYEQIE
jgi:hypothetical protein